MSHPISKRTSLVWILRENEKFWKYFSKDFDMTTKVFRIGIDLGGEECNSWHIVKQESNMKKWGQDIVLIHLGCHSKITQTRWLKQEKFISHNPRVCKVLDQGASKVGFILRLLLLACRQLPSWCMLTWPFSLCKRVRASSLMCLLIRTLILWNQSLTFMN